MTFGATKAEICLIDQHRRKTMGISEAMTNILTHARDERRVTCGIYESGRLLEKRPENVMLCLLPEVPADDVTMHIHYTLIEAFCWENDIRLIHVDSEQKLALILEGSITPDKSAAAATHRHSIEHADYSCVLVEYPEKICEQDENILEFHRQTSTQSPPPTIALLVE